MKRAIMSTCRDPQHRSDKACTCGGHQGRRGKKRRRVRRPRCQHCGLMPAMRGQELCEECWRWHAPIKG